MDITPSELWHSSFLGRKVFLDFLVQMCHILSHSRPTRISDVLGVTGQLGLCTDQELDPFQETVFFHRKKKKNDSHVLLLKSGEMGYA